jgi:predicted Zn-dependent peptidase
MKIKFIFSALCMALTLSVATAQDLSIKYDAYTLDNGLDVILHQDKSTPIVTVGVMYHVGSKNENPDRTGFAHFFEHLLFEGSENIDRGEFSEYVQNAGGQLNAYTSNDVTFYFETLPSNQLKLGLWLESERMLHAKVDQKGVETQREVVKEEMRQRYENSPYGTFLLEVLKRAYKEYPYRWPTIGSMDHLNAATEEDYINWYKNYYVPNNAVLVIVGDFEQKEAKSAIEEYFGPIPKKKGGFYRPNVVEPPLGGEVRDTIYDEVQLPAVFQSYRIPNRNHEDIYAVQMLAKLLSEGESSRMRRALVDEQEKALAVQNVIFDFEGPSLAIAFAIANAGVEATAVEEAMDAEIKKVQEELISETEFQKLRNQVETEFFTSNASTFGIANSLATYHTLSGDVDLINTELEKYQKVTREDIRRVANKYFSPDNRVVLYYLPKPAKP